MDITKHAEFFDALEISTPIHIVGVGAVGSSVAELLVRLGLSNITLWDEDIVQSHNIANQMYRAIDLDRPKTEALKEQLLLINPNCIITERKFYIAEELTTPMLSGYVFLCVDSVQVRRDIVRKHMNLCNVLGVFDFRMRLTDAQHFAANWTDQEARKRLLSTLDFTDEEAREATPVSACGSTLSIISTVRMLTAVGISNFVNFVKGEKLKHCILIDAFAFTIYPF